MKEQNKTFQVQEEEPTYKFKLQRIPTQSPTKEKDVAKAN